MNTLPRALSLIPAAGLAATAAWAEPPRVVVDTLPLHSLTARIMEGAGVPELLLAPGASPHDAALRPSDARRLSDAEALIWTGPQLLPWLPEAAATLAPDAAVLSLLDAPGWPRLPLRDDPAFEHADHHGHDDDHDAHAEDEHGEEHEVHDGEAHEHEDDDHEEHGHDEHDEHGHDEHGQDHHAEETGATDPHAWLDPQVAALWGGLIADHLAALDPDNAALYAANAAEMAQDFTALEADIAGQLAPLDAAYLVSHDAYQYFEVRFAFPAAGAISLSDAAAPGPARLAALRDDLAAGGIACILADPDAPAARAAMLTESTDVRIAQADPDAMFLTPGPDLYEEMMRSLATALADCLTDG